MKKAIFSFGLLLVSAAFSISSSAQTASTALTDPRWNLIEINGVAVQNSAVYVRFDTQKHTYHGTNGCDFITGRYRVDGPNLTFTQSIITRRACQGPEVEKVQKEFGKVFYSTTRFWIYEDQLRLYKGDQLMLVFKAGPVLKSN